ncbi:2-oxoglutarate and iron-dependent oxygenase domain-containing protein [Microbacterium maritypicum]|uniref:isopenicillin N synthase family dioxygenase n=1 Tax=Microbacterium maritypicum TaxID=33918 RepID=UPI00296E6371|nr:2-oxoglutarate and iron-dependent oxygenase domain-containing protein [Microbacterium liquefaciens]
MTSTAETILDVDLLKFEHGSETQRRAVVDGTMRSLKTGFVYASADLPTRLLDDAYEVLARFFTLPVEKKTEYVSPESHGSRGYTGVLVETSVVSETPDWKEMLNWGEQLPVGHPLRTRYPLRYQDQVFPTDEDIGIEGVSEILTEFHDCLVRLQTRFLRIIAVGIGAHETFFDTMVEHGSHWTRAIRYPPMTEAPSGNHTHLWAGEHGDINLITALPRATAKGLQVFVESDGNTTDARGLTGDWVDATPPEDYVIINTGILLEHITNGLIPIGWHRVISDVNQLDERMSVVQFFHPTPSTVLMPVPSTVTADQPCRFSAINAEDQLEQEVWEMNLIDDARRVKD